MAIYAFNGFIPVIKESSFVHPQASVTGNVIIGEHVYIGPGAAIRGDWGQIIIEDGCNVQENCTIHMFPGTTVTLKKGAHIGHGAIIHGGTIGENCLIGMNSVVMDDVTIEDECIIGALCFVPANMLIPKRSLVVGNPAKIIKKRFDDHLINKLLLINISELKYEDIINNIDFFYQKIDANNIDQILNIINHEKS
jgi:carbonic anhydrase/acetyltransferase-like protein (isoleucine patch superfamily)